MNSNIEKLKEITSNLNPLPFTKMIDKKKSYVKVASTSGTIMLFPIYKDENMAICLSFMSKGMVIYERLLFSQISQMHRILVYLCPCRIVSPSGAGFSHPF